MNKPNSWLKRAETLLASRRFWWLVLALLVLQAAWIALSGKYPLAFDEDFHLGIIRLYAHHISPFWSNQPENADMFGAVARDPSYLYQYLMSFPYRLFTVFAQDQTIIVILLRFISIGLFASGLALFRKLLFKTGVSRAIAHVCLLVFVLLPIGPLLAAQINYDNLLLPVVAVALLLAVRLDQLLTSRKQVDAATLSQLLTVCLLACLVKYAFLPIFLAIAGFIIVRLWQLRPPADSLTTTWRSINRWGKLGLAVGLVAALGLFAQRIGYNVVRYHTPAPDCSKVLTVEQCSEYGPWIRDYNFKLNKVPGATTSNPLIYTGEWFYGMWLRTFFAVGGPETNFQTRGPLLLPALGSIGFSAVGIVAFGLGAKKIFKRYDAPVLWLLMAAAISYVGFLWLDDYLAYLRTGQPVAINGRYLLPVLLPLLMLAAAALAEVIKKRPTSWKISLLVLPVACLVWGGGALTFILRSNDSWYWNNDAVRSANHAVQRVLGPVTPGYRRPNAYLR